MAGQTHYDLIVISGGNTGLSAAYRVARAGRRVALIDKGPVGGLCSLAGCNPKKVIVRASEVLETVRQAGEHGVITGEVSIDWERVWKRKHSFTDPVPDSTERSLAEIGIVTVANLRDVELEVLTARFGKHGRILWEFSRGIDERPVETHSERKSVSTENTYNVDLADLAAMEAEVDRMAAEVARFLERSGLGGCTVTLKVRYADFTTVTRSRTFPVPVCDGVAIALCARDLLRRTEAPSRPVRLLGVTSSNLVRERISQLPLFL